MDSIKDEFLKIYSEELQKTMELPEGIAAQYSLEACLKSTSEKRIYLLRSRFDGSLYILKQTSKNSMESLKSEFALLSSLYHPSFPRPVGYTEDDQCCYMIREYIPGDSLFNLVERNGVFSEKETLDAAISICESLSYLHNRNTPVIHRDIKPQNIVMTPEGEYKLVDMGTSRYYKNNAALDTVFMGTQATAAPEQFGYGQTDSRCDIYALGVLMVYLLSGDFKINSEALHGISKRLRKIIAKCTAFDPGKRYAAVDILKRSLLHCLDRKPIPRHLIVKVCACSGMFLIGLGAWYFASRPDPAQVVKFQSPFIEKAIRLELGKKDKEPVLRSELANVTQILICGNTVFSDWNQHRSYYKGHYLNDQPIEGGGDISSLEDLKLLKNLNTLVLDGQSISDISPLKGLPLKKLSLCKNNITNLSALSGCINLTCLRVEENPITDIQPLENMTKLDTVDIGFTGIKSLAPVRKLPIRELRAIEAKVEDYSPMGQLSGLEILSVKYLPQKGLEIIAGITSLRDLTIYNSGIDSFDAFTKLNKLETLDLTSNNLYDLSGISMLKSLRTVRLGDNRIKSLLPLVDLPYIDNMDICNADITDISELLKISGLKYLSCDQRQADTLRENVTEFPFQIVVR